MFSLITVRLGSSLATMIGASICAFILVRVLPGDPVRLIVGDLASPEAVESVRESIGLDQPLYVQYYRYVGDFVQGDWGFAYSAGQPVTTLITTRLPASLELGLYAFVFAAGWAVTLALITTYRRRRAVDGAVRTLSFLGLGTPPFWLALLLLLVFSQYVHLFPGPEGRLSPGTAPPPSVTYFYTIDALIAGQWSTFANAVWHLVLPVVALGFASFAFFVRLLRASMLELSREPFVVVAQSKGLGRWQAFYRHVLPNASLPALTAGGLILAEIVTGSVLIETVFDWPGVGALVVDSISQKDFAVLQSFILLSAFAYVAVNLLLDVLYPVIDPRVRSRSAV